MGRGNVYVLKNLNKVTQNHTHKTVLKLTTFVCLSFPNNEFLCQIWLTIHNHHWNCHMFCSSLFSPSKHPATLQGFLGFMLKIK
jgi:hypothetical protein